eukprot:125502_1
MGQGTVNFLNALQCIRDHGINKEISKHCIAYIYHQMIFEMKSIIKKSIEKSGGTVPWTPNLFKHCVTDSLLIYGFVKQLMTYDHSAHQYTFANRPVTWSSKDTNTDTTVCIGSTIMSTIIRFYQSPETVQQWLDILFLKRSNNSSVINHYIMSNVDIGQFILDLFNEFDKDQKHKLRTHYDLGVAHYFSQLERICAPEYKPQPKDIILMSKSIGFSSTRKNTRYHKSNSINELKDLEFRSSLYHFTNIQPMFRTAVKRWIYQFEDQSDALIFLIPLTTYYKWDSKWDTFNLILNFQTITNNNWLKQCSFHLFLTGKELFKKSLATTPFKFSNYTGDTSSYTACIEFLIQYIKSKLIADNKGDKRQIYIHVVSLYHLDQLETSFAEVCGVLHQKKEPTHVKHHSQISSQKFEL